MGFPIQTEPELRRDVLLVALVTAPFFLNDFGFLASKTVPQWLVADYGSKLLALVILLAVLPLRRAAAGTLKLKRPLSEAVVLVAVCTGLIFFIDHFFRSVIDIEIDSLVLFRYPAVESKILYWVDITIGLAVTAISEEFVFRGVFAVLMARYLPGTTLMVVVSAVVFALIHWSHGVTSMVVAGLAGVALMALYLRTGSVLPGIAAHYFVNLADFI